MVCSKKIEKVVTIFIYLWVWWSTSILMYVEAATHGDSLMPGDTLNATSTLYSKNNKFFIYFSTSDDNVDNHFVIAAIKEGYTQIVWNFNRIPPLPLSAVLSLNHSGFLKIESQYGKPIIIYSPSEPTNNTVATLLDNGNFVLRELHPNGTLKNTVLWQSFDYPVDWLIPGMKLGVNRKIGRKWLVLSNILISNSNSGVFSLEWEQSELVIKQRGKVYWKSGKLRNNGTIFDNISERRQQMFQYTIVSNTDEDSFTFKIKIENKKKVGAWKLFPNGELKSGYGTIANADMCYGFNTSDEIGCQKWDIPTCRKPGDVFQPKAGSPSYKNVINKENSSYVYSDCKCFCWNNCKCIGFQQYNENGTGCILFEENSTIEYDYGEKKVISYILTKPLQESPQQLHRKIHGAIYESSEVKELEDQLKDHDIKVFNYGSILAATTGFSEENKLGQGGYGPVYKGILTTGQEVAVKRLAKTSGQGVVEFKNELTLICELQHTNLVRLLGCCIHGEDKILIYEYMQNKSLDVYLFECTRRSFLDWEKRFNIIEGISQGLLYLHKYSRLKIIHRDLKTSNILLDENFKPKISDFGMARLFTQQESTVNTNRIVGTYGYMSPEYAMEGLCSTKSDVYSFGVLLLEIVSGRKNNSFYDDDHPLNLIGYAWELWKEDRCSQLMDPSLTDTFIPDEVQRCIHVGLLCVEHYADDRPNMSNVISMLTNKNTIIPLPKRPAFYVERGTNQETTPFKLSETYSSKDISTLSTFSDVE